MRRNIVFSREQIVSFLSEQKKPVTPAQIIDHFYDVKERKERGNLFGTLLALLKKMHAEKIVDRLVFGSGRGDLYYLRKSSKITQQKTPTEAGKSSDMISVVLMDSNVLFREGLKQLLSSWQGIQVSTDAGNGKVLIEKLSKTAVVPGICIMSSPALLSDNGQTIMRLKNDFPSMKLLILADHYHQFMISKILRCGAGGYLTKQCAPEELKKAIYGLHEQGSYWGKIPKRFLNTCRNKKVSDLLLTEKEITFLSLCCTDISYEEISERMGVSIRTLENYRDSLFKIFGVNNKLNLIVSAVKAGVTEIK